MPGEKNRTRQENVKRRIGMNRNLTVPFYNTKDQTRFRLPWYKLGHGEPVPLLRPIEGRCLGDQAQAGQCRHLQ